MSKLPASAPDFHSHHPRLLATDLDGTLIPLPGHEDQRADLQTLAQGLQRREVRLAFVTGRHLESVQDAKQQHALPAPNWIICDVGTSIYGARDDHDYQPLPAYQSHLAQVTQTLPRELLQERLAAMTALTLQEPHKQGPFKLSFYVNAAQLQQVVLRVQELLHRLEAPYGIVDSVDPFNGDGLLDLLPKGVSKAYALNWLAQQEALPTESIVFAGDSGNDLAALTAGYRAIVVGNADRQLARQVQAAHDQQGWTGRLYLARQSATSGVLEGCRWFGVI